MSNDSSTSAAHGGGTDLSLDEGIGVWTGFTSTNAVLVIMLGNGASSLPGGTWSFELAVSSGGE